jgi:hypothetical protein
MRLADWRAKAPLKDAVGPRVIAVIEEALVTLGAELDPECWVLWGDDPNVRYLILVPTASGMLQINVRVAVPGEGPRVSGKVVRWNRLQLGELAVEIQGGHRLVTFQVESQVLNGADASADAIAAFAQSLFAAVDGRLPATPPAARRGASTAQKGSTTPSAARQLAEPKGSAS